ncbi:MAG: NAD(P)H-hydrate dehydratase [Prolixibacteraceae bacterium]|nr:NAD(P)H-hydrate dehydratase [Prolixibacteraceae bacterium]MBN2650529.1 NAD(P)H-hydrate dehydratase [Prolixibacteraceae bacterium]
MKLFTTKQIPEIDRYTIEAEPIADIDLMERAAEKVAAFIAENETTGLNYYVFCGPGNNGGDGLAVARMLAENTAASVRVFILDFGKGLAGSSEINFNRLKNIENVSVSFLSEMDELPRISNNAVIVDALFGSGLNRALNGLPADIVRFINTSVAKVYSIDVPSGLMGEDNGANIAENIVQASYTVTFQFPKIAFMFPESEAYTGRVEVVDIGLHPKAIAQMPTSYFMFDDAEAHKLIKQRQRFSHKGTYGHALLIAGAYGKMGAAILGAKACLRSGVGLLTLHLPHTGWGVLQSAVPEAMASIDDSDLMFTSVPHPESYTAIGVGPAIGKKTNTVRGLKELLKNTDGPMVLDADALNIISENNDLLALLPPNSVLTPHPKEFERLAGKVENGYQRMIKAKQYAYDNNVVMVVKGANTMVVNPSGQVWWNTTGNAGMATAGSGDTLTGIILALLAQGYAPFDAARLGVFVHGLAGDIAAARRGYEALIASDITENLGEAFKLVHK